MKFDPQTDFGQLLTLFMDYYETAPDFFGHLNVKKMGERLAQAVLSHDSFVIKDGDKLVGALVLDELPGSWWGDETYLADLIIFVYPEYRTFANIRTLVNEANEYAKMKDKKLELMLFNPEDLDRKGVLMKRLGFKHVGSLFEGGKSSGE